MHRISFDRRVLIGSTEVWRDGRYDAVIPVVDGRPLAELLGGDVLPGLRANLALLPSRQWLGAPTYEERGDAVVLDGRCGEAGCCGVFARITVAAEVVRWDGFWGRGRFEPPDLALTFDRAQYEAALIGG